MTRPRFGYRGTRFPSWMLTFALSLGLLAPEKASFNFMEATLLREAFHAWVWSGCFSPRWALKWLFLQRTESQKHQLSCTQICSPQKTEIIHKRCFKLLSFNSQKPWSQEMIHRTTMHGATEECLISGVKVHQWHKIWSQIQKSGKTSWRSWILNFYKLIYL